MKPIKLKVTIPLLTPLHVGGEPGSDTNTSYILRGPDGVAYYPGTAFKGKVRHYARQLSDAPCAFPDPCKCDVCRLFGGEGNAPGSLFFSNFYAVEEQTGCRLEHKKPPIDLRAGNAIDRFRRVAADEKLFTTESAAISALEGYITGNVSDVKDPANDNTDLPKDEESADDNTGLLKDVRFLKESIKLIRQIGGNTSRGFGWVKVDIDVLEEQGDAYQEPVDASDEPVEVNEEQAESSDHEDTGPHSGSEPCVRVILTPKSPLLIGTHTTQSNFRDTQSIIPGAVLRAALARAICEQDCTKDPSKEVRITVLPEGEETNFPNLRQAFSELRFSALNSNIQSAPYPITTRKCKFHEDHKKVDVLTAILKSREAKCPECGGRLEKLAPYEFFEEHAPTITSTHSEMDKQRGTARDGRLFTVRAIAPRTAVFSGTISGDIDFGELSRLLRPTLRVGAMLTAGFGECKVELKPFTVLPDDGLSDRIKRFKELIGCEDNLIPITLMSDAIIDFSKQDDDYYIKTDDYLKAYEKLVNPVEGEHDFEMVHAMIKSRIWRGFDTGKQGGGFEKPAKFLLQAGSVLVVRANAPDAPTMLEKLLKLEQNGIGLETQDGYGAVRVAHENHINNALKWKEDNLDD